MRFVYCSLNRGLFNVLGVCASECTCTVQCRCAPWSIGYIVLLCVCIFYYRLLGELSRHHRTVCTRVHVCCALEACTMTCQSCYVCVFVVTGRVGDYVVSLGSVHRNVHVLYSAGVYCDMSFVFSLCVLFIAG